MHDARPICKNNKYAKTINNLIVKLKEILFTIVQKRTKLFRDKFNKEILDLYTKNYKILLKEIKEGLIRRKAFHIHGPEDLILLN